MTAAAKELARWVKPHGETLVLRLEPSGKTRLYHKPYKGARYALSSIVVGRKANGGPVYSSRATLSQADEWATRAGFERVQR